jgi:hypothetical protein
LICKWVMQRLWSPPPQAYTARISPERRSGSDLPVVRPFPPSLRAMPRLTTCVNDTQDMRKPTRSGGFVRTADSDRRPGLTRICGMTADAAATDRPHRRKG